MSTTLKVMSFNLRTWCNDGPYSFPYRTERIREMLLREDPDLIGFQEFTSQMKALLRSLLPEYTIVGCGRERDYSGESMAIAMKNGVIEMLSLEQFWLSPTPTMPGSRYTEDQSPCPRMALSAVLVTEGCEKPFRIINTHLDHMGPQARYHGMMQIIQHISAHEEPFILTGDMNALPDSPEMKLADQMLGSLGGVQYTKDVGGTFHGYGKVTRDNQIDYIYSDLACNRAWKVEEIDDKVFYSDHYAVMTELVL